jgi:AcrR family transcriptional regulator
VTTSPPAPAAPAAAPVPATRTARERARAEVTAEILATAGHHLAADGAAALSLRAIARDLGMVSSAVYRYVPSRDDLLTRLIVQAYDSLGAAAETAEAAVDRSDLSGRFRAVAFAVRDWALANPHEYALLYGTPVPGYQAPQDTIPPATRVPALLLGLLVQAVLEGRPVPREPVPPAAAAALEPLREWVPPQVPDDLMLRGLLAWSSLFGAVSFELFGHLHNVVGERADLRTAYAERQVESLLALAGLADQPG